MEPWLQLALGIVATILVSALGGDRIGQRIRQRRRDRCTLLIGVDKNRRDVELRYVRPKENNLVWGTEKTGSLVTNGVVQPGEESSFTLSGSGRAYLVDRATLRTMRISSRAGEMETAPEDGWQVGMYAAGVHERNVARPSGGTWLDTLAGYTPILVIVLGVVMIGGFIALSRGTHG